MNFQQLEYAIAVNREGHFGKAADSVNITQATLSAMLKKLEGELGYQLFDRSRHPIQTTDLGLGFMEHARSVLELRDRMLQLGREEGEAFTGKLTLGVIPTVAHSLLPIILPRITADHPELELTIAEVTTEEMVQRLNADQLDLGIMVTPWKQNLPLEEILYYEAMMVYGIRDSGKEFVSSKDVRDQQVWLLEEGHCFRDQTLTVCDLREMSDRPGNLKFEGNSFETLLNMSDAFGGLALVPELYVKYLSPEKQKAIRSFKKPVPVREVSLVAGRTHAHLHAVDYLKGLIREIVPPMLESTKRKKGDLEIIGF